MREALSPNMAPSNTHPQLFTERQREFSVLKKINLEVKRASEFKQENARPGAKDMVTLSRETSMHA